MIADAIAMTTAPRPAEEDAIASRNADPVRDLTHLVRFPDEVLPVVRFPDEVLPGRWERPQVSWHPLTVG
jgi:hypothetical protein